MPLLHCGHHSHGAAVVPETNCKKKWLLCSIRTKLWRPCVARNQTFRPFPERPQDQYLTAPRLSRQGTSQSASEQKYCAPKHTFPPDVGRHKTNRGRPRGIFRALSERVQNAPRVSSELLHSNFRSTVLLNFKHN